jgi:hypothetical protein
MLDGPAANEMQTPVVQPPPKEAPKQAPGKPVAERPAATGPAQETGEKKGSETPVETDADNLDPGEVRDLADLLAAADETIKEIPEAYTVILRTIASKGNLAENLILTGQAVREGAENAPTEGEKALTDEQRQRQLALGYDEEIGGLQIKLNQTKNQKEKLALSNKIKTLQQEKKDKTGIEENQLNGLAELFKLDGFTKLIDDHIKNGTPIVAVEKILEQAVLDKNIRINILKNLKEAGFSDEQIKVLQKNLHDQENVKRIKKGAKTIGMGSLIGMLLMMYSGFKKEK